MQISQISASSKPTIIEEIETEMFKVRTLQQIVGSDQAEYVWVPCVISAIIPERGWYFMSCKKCVRKLKEEDGKCYCIHCKEYCNGEIRYKLNINVVDGTECVTLLLWDTQSRELIGKTARELKDKIAKDTIGNDTNPKMIPTEIECIVGQEYFFKINVNQKNVDKQDTVYTVVSVSKDADLIKRFKLTDHIIDISNDSENGNMETNTTEQDSVSDNEVTSPNKTPRKATKDTTGKTQVNESDCGSTALSSTKLKKVKVEKN
ncbi:uncharacterized protein LOC127791644 [Diospyros lotus]|uniref:uncharacterized protein LOC127791644 n=1 Tax=Diospyros lotus TaxID=55363 RepID=UPI00224F7FC2|nr:uncharacterized protein LOC127791644 [Diospyros lotus]